MQTEEDPPKVLPNSLLELQKARSPFHPYYPTLDYFETNEIVVLAVVELLERGVRVCLHSYSKNERPIQWLLPTELWLEGPLSNRNVSTLKIIKCCLVETGLVRPQLKELALLLGSSAGHVYIASFSQAKIIVTHTFNKDPAKIETKLQRLSAFVMSRSEPYAVFFKGVVRKISRHTKGPYCYSYQVGSQVFLRNQLLEEEELALLRGWAQINWDQQKETSPEIVLNSFAYFKAHHNQVANGSIFVLSSPIFIHSYVYNQNLLYLCTADARISVHSVPSAALLWTLTFPVDVRDLAVSERFVIVLPASNGLYIIDTSEMRFVYLAAQKSFISSCHLEINELICCSLDRLIFKHSLQKEQSWINLPKDGVVPHILNGAKLNIAYTPPLPKGTKYRDGVGIEVAYARLFRIRSEFCLIDYDSRIQLLKFFTK